MKVASVYLICLGQSAGNCKVHVACCGSWGGCSWQSSFHSRSPTFPEHSFWTWEKIKDVGTKRIAGSGHSDFFNFTVGIIVILNDFCWSSHKGLVSFSFPLPQSGFIPARCKNLCFFSLLSNSPYWDLAMVWWSLALFFSLVYTIHEFDWFLPLPSHRRRKPQSSKAEQLKLNWAKIPFLVLFRSETRRIPTRWLFDIEIKSKCFSTSPAAMFFAVVFVYYSEVTKEHDSNSGQRRIRSGVSRANSLGTRLNIVTQPPRSRDVAPTSIVG